jgi:hypothetical protein
MTKQPRTLSNGRAKILWSTFYYYVRELTFDDLLQLMIFSSPTILKRYLVYLIVYDHVSYNGQMQVYLIKDKGLELLCSLARKLKQY